MHTGRDKEREFMQQMDGLFESLLAQTDDGQTPVCGPRSTVCELKVKGKSISYFKVC